MLERPDMAFPRFSIGTMKNPPPPLSSPVEGEEANLNPSPLAGEGGGEGELTIFILRGARIMRA
jgi:hypothetical protein